MTVKRLIAFLLMIAMALSLCACDRDWELQLLVPPPLTLSQPEQESSMVEDESEYISNEETKVDTEDETVDESKDDLVEGECTPLLYQVTVEDGGTVYLFGTIHVGDKRMAFPDYVTDAFENSDYLCVEADIIAFEGDMAAAINAVKKMLCPLGSSTDDYLEKDIYEKALKFLEDNNAYNSIYNMYKPIMWYSLIDSVLMERTELESERGADRQLLEQAKEDRKEIREAESAEFQYDMLASFSDKLVELMIESTLETAEYYGSNLMGLYEMWLKGDEAQFVAYMDGEEDFEGMTDEEIALYEEYNKAMETDRNLAMADLVEEYLEEDETGFFAVGAAHIVGEGAVVELLRDRGYTVTLVK